MKTTNHFLTFFAILCALHVSIAQQIGDPGWVFDESKYDNRFPAMREYAKAGVQGGIPYRSNTPIKQTLSVISGDSDMANNIQSAINAVNSSGGGVVLLKNGTYPIRSQITMKSNVILRGESKNGVVLEVFMRFQGASEPKKKEVFYWKNVQNAGLEDLSMIYNADYQGRQMYPLDHDWAFTYFSAYSIRSQNYPNERVYHDRPNFKYHTVKNIDVIYVRMDGTTKNCWIDNCNFRDSGSAHLIVSNPSKHITIRNTLVRGAFQKGNNGHGYGINCSGSYVLMVKNTVKNVRHWAIQQGAIYNVVYDCHSETDMNFHQGDRGLNLIEKNKLHRPYWHLWKVIGTGASYHGDPGQGNMFYDNDVIDGNNGKKYTDKKVYTFNTDRNVVPMFNTPPKYGTLYALKRSGGNGGGQNQLPNVSFSGITEGAQLDKGASIKPVVDASDPDGSIANVKLYINNQFIRQENAAPYEWGHLADKDDQLKNLEDGNYTLKAEATDNKGGKTTKTLSLKVGNSGADTQLIANGTYFIESTESNQRLLSRSQENHNAMMHNPGNYNDQKWVFNHLGDNIYTIKNSSTNRFLEVPYARCGNANNVATYTSAGGDHQKWKAFKTENTFAFKPLHCQNVALDRAGGAINANIHTWSYSTTNQNQKWRLEAMTTSRNLSGNKSEKNNMIMMLYPNPAKDVITIQGIPHNTPIKVFDFYGNEVIKSRSEGNMLKVNKLPSGVYFLQTDKGSKAKFLIQ